MADIEPMPLLGPASLPSGEQSAPAAGPPPEHEEPNDEAEVHPREDREAPQQQPSDTPNEGKGGSKENRGREGGRKLGTAAGDSGSDSDEQWNEDSDEDGNEHRRSRANPWADSSIPRTWRKGTSTPNMQANRAAERSATSETPAAIRRRRVQQLHRIWSYPRRVFAAIFGNEAEAQIYLSEGCIRLSASADQEPSQSSG